MSLLSLLRALVVGYNKSKYCTTDLAVNTVTQLLITFALSSTALPLSDPACCITMLHLLQKYGGKVQNQPVNCQGMGIPAQHQCSKPFFPASISRLDT